MPLILFPAKGLFMKPSVVAACLIVIALLTTAAYHLLKPDWILFRKAETYFSEKAFSQAIPVYARLLERGFEAPALVSHLGTAYVATGRFREAAAIFEDILRKAPDKLQELKELANIYVAFGQFKKAIPLYQTFLQQEPYNRSVRILLARALSWSGRFDEAIVEYRKAVGDET